MLKTTYRRGAEDYTLVVGKVRGHGGRIPRKLTIPEDEQRTARVNPWWSGRSMMALHSGYEPSVSVKDQDSLMLTEEGPPSVLFRSGDPGALRIPNYTSRTKVSIARCRCGNGKMET